MNDATFFSGGGFIVTDRLLRTPRKTYSIHRIEYVSVERPLLLFVLPPMIGLIGFAIVFRRYLYASEIITLIGVCALAATIAFLFGTLRVHSLALRDSEVASSLGLITTLRHVRSAVEKAMAFAEHRTDAP
ncbi:hypothetical protein [Aquamicrobium ahrensii]|uniref:Uncharacterized protein n=1 Tax=Aquamicrobium ahrensii TaxID=469551 RepID=A0ABV2KP57_9HYPH